MLRKFHQKVIKSLNISWAHLSARQLCMFLFLPSDCIEGRKINLPLKIMYPWNTYETWHLSRTQHLMRHVHAKFQLFMSLVLAAFLKRCPPSCTSKFLFFLNYTFLLVFVCHISDLYESPLCQSIVTFYLRSSSKFDAPSVFSSRVAFFFQNIHSNVQNFSFLTHLEHG